MKFPAITLIVHAPDPITGVQVTMQDRFRQVISDAVLAPLRRREIADPPWPVADAAVDDHLGPKDLQPTG